MRNQPYLLTVLLLCCSLGLACSATVERHGNEPSAATISAPAADDWPSFGGPGGDFRVTDLNVAESWPQSGPSELWSQPIGKGYSAVSIAGEHLFVVSREDNFDVVQARLVSDGSIVWEQRYEELSRENQSTQFGVGPNAAPLIYEGVVVTLGFAGSLNGWDQSSGEPLWSHQLIDQFGGVPLDFGYAASPIGDGGNVIVLCGGEQAGAIAFDPATGDERWRGTPTSVSYATPITIDLDGQRQIVYFASDAIVGLDATNGQQLWSFPVVNQYHNNATMPLWGDNDLLWVATQLDGGSRALRLTRNGDATEVEEVWVSNKMSVHYWNTLRVGDEIYASIGSNASILAGIDLTNGEILWRQRGFEQVNFVHTGDLSILLDANGVLAIARLSTEGIDVLDQAVLSEERHWTAPILVGTTLFVRNESTLRAFDLSAQQPAATDD